MTDVQQLTIDDLLRFMSQENASDLHLKPMRPPLLRLNGRLLALKSDPLTPDMINALIDEILNDRQRETLEKEMAVDFGYSVRKLSRFRCSVFLQRGTRSAIFRRVPFDFRSLEDWGLPEVLNECVNLPQGLVLITGPTGSGKSSTLAAMMRLIADSHAHHIVTIEDPIEFLLSDSKSSVTQREVGTDTPSFAHALRNVLRQDPDVIMVGEMRDPETTQTVLTAAETGHLVFSTLHTNGAAHTIDRIIDSFPEGNHRQIRQQLASVLEAVISLKLVERKNGEGLIAAVEILRRTPKVSKLIEQGNLEGLNEEIEASVTYHNMQSMNQSLAALVVHDQIEYDAALKVSHNPGDLDLILRKLLYRSENPTGEESDMAEPLSDFSKIRELQEVKRLYEESEERHSHELGERDAEIARLSSELAGAVTQPADSGEADQLRAENDRLNKQIQLVRQEYDAKLERLNARIKEISGKAGATPVAAESNDRKGFFRR